MLTRRHQNRSRKRGRTLSYTILIAFVFLTSFPGCSLFKKFERVVTVTVTETKDSIIIRDHYIHDTARVEIPVYIEKNVTKDDSSRLENPFAVSTARIKDGLLFHDLRTKPQTIKTPVDVLVTDTTSFHEHSEKKDSVYTKTEYIEKPLTTMQRVKIKYFWWLLGGLILCLGWIFRKPMLKFLKIIAKL